MTLRHRKTARLRAADLARSTRVGTSTHHHRDGKPEGPEGGSSQLHERIEAALGWEPGQARSFSLPALRDLLRPVNVDLADEVTLAMLSQTSLVDRRRLCQFCGGDLDKDGHRSFCPVRWELEWQWA